MAVGDEARALSITLLLSSENEPYPSEKGLCFT